jgi:hypothetical protein
MTLHTAMKRKAERERIAQLFEAMAERISATCTRDRYEIDGVREISLYLTKDGCTVNVDLDGDSRVGCFLAHWFFDSIEARRGRLFRTGFEGAGDTSRPHHKATLMADHAEDLCAMIEGRFHQIADGSAFVLEEPAPSHS